MVTPPSSSFPSFSSLIGAFQRSPKRPKTLHTPFPHNSETLLPFSLLFSWLIGPCQYIVLGGRRRDSTILFCGKVVLRFYNLFSSTVKKIADYVADNLFVKKFGDFNTWVSLKPNKGSRMMGSLPYGWGIQVRREMFLFSSDDTRIIYISGAPLEGQKHVLTGGNIIYRSIYLSLALYGSFSVDFLTIFPISRSF